MNLLGLKILRKLRLNEKKKNLKIRIGLLYEFVLDKYNGDYFFVFNFKKKKYLKFGFEYSDNSF